MLVIGYSDFSADMNKYLETAAVSGLKILPRKKEKKTFSSSAKICPSDRACFWNYSFEC